MGQIVRETVEETKPTITFQELGLSEPLIKAIVELGYEEPTPIQARTIALILAGQDVIAQAQTGTGKTGAFALPIIERLTEGRTAPQSLVLTPTRELAVQVAEAFHSYSKYRHISVLPVYGGQPIERQLRALDRGVHVVVGTPGRILDHIRRGTLKLGEVRTVILDEADEMLAMGFIEDIEAILQETPEGRQTALFSATMPKPIADLAQRYMHKPERITIQSEHMTVSQIRQTYYEVGGRDKFEVLCRVLDYERPTSAIIFCRTKSEVDGLGMHLIARAYPAETLHGDLSQVQRDRVMGRFRSEQVELLVATDVAARGLDIDHVSHVINFDIPLDPEVYVHRTGRTGRAGRAGCAITLVTPRERRLLHEIERATGAPIQRMQIPKITDVIARRRETFQEALREMIAQGGLESYQVIAESMGDEYSPTDLAAAAFKMLLGEQPDTTVDTLAEVEDNYDSRDKNGKRRRNGNSSASNGSSNGNDSRNEPRSGRPRREFGSDSNMTRLYIDVGREDGARPADIVGAIANEADIPGRSIGAIEMYEHFSFVDVPSNHADRVLRALKHTTIRGRKVTPSIAKPKPATDR